MDHEVIVREQHEKHLDEMDQFFKRYKLPEFNQEEIICRFLKWFKISISSYKSPNDKKNLDINGFISEVYPTFNEEIVN